MVNQYLKLLLSLQEIDASIARWAGELQALPAQIEEKRSLIQAEQAAFESEKNNLTQVQLKRKAKEGELASQEEKIKKHEAELNSVKTNEAYRALLSEIEAAKGQKSQTEDEILELMEETDRAAQGIKGAEQRSKQAREELEQEVRQIESRIEKAKAALAEEQKRRDSFAPQIPAEVLARYDFIRTKKKSLAVVPIRLNSCEGCNTALTPNLFNEVKKGKDLVTCETCSRILYIEEDLAAPSAPAPVAAGASGGEGPAPAPSS